MLSNIFAASMAAMIAIRPINAKALIAVLRRRIRWERGALVLISYIYYE
jgi:hypothetical protein